MRWGLLQIVIAVGLAFGATPASAEIVVNQQPEQGGGYGSDTDFLNTIGNPTWQQIADNIRLAQSTTIRGLNWWGFYGGDEQNHNPPSGSETMRVRFYGPRASDGLPDESNILFERSFNSLPRTLTGRTVAVQGDPAEYLFQVDLVSDIALDAATTYWLEVAQIGDPSSHFRWETGFGAVPGFAAKGRLTSGQWQSSTGSMAFQLLTIPEPTMGMLVIVAFGLATSRRAGLS